MKSIRERMSGNEAVAYAIRQVNPDVMPAFPITPSTEIPQMVSTYIANGEIDTEFIPVESEHSAMSAAIGSEAAGARTMTATSSAGLALMGGAAAGGLQPPAAGPDPGEPHAFRSHQYQLRPLGRHGRQRHGMDPDLCREQSGSL